MKQRRDNHGKIKDSIWQRFKSWRLGRKIRKGKLPRGRVITSAEAVAAIEGTLRGCMSEIWGLLSARKFEWTSDLPMRKRRVLLKLHTLEQLQAQGLGRIIDMGLISVKKITTAFRDYMVDSLQDSTTYPMDAFNYHGCGTGTTAEANTQTALVTEVGSRQAGTQTEGASANIFRSVATLTPGGSYAITEHGIFSASTAGTMMDRSLFSAINVAASDSIEFTYEATFNAEA